MKTWCVKKASRFGSVVKSWPNCDTVGCIAGWTVNIVDPYSNRDFIDFFGEASDLLDINEKQADRLFFVNYWPSRFIEKEEFYEDDSFIRIKGNQSHKQKSTLK